MQGHPRSNQGALAISLPPQEERGPPPLKYTSCHEWDVTQQGGAKRTLSGKLRQTVMTGAPYMCDRNPRWTKSSHTAQHPFSARARARARHGPSHHCTHRQARVRVQRLPVLSWLGPGAPQEEGRGTLATHRQVSPAMKSRMAPISSLFQKSLKYRDATFFSPHPSGS